MTSPLPSLGDAAGSPENFLSTSPAWPNPTSSIEYFLGRAASQDDDDRFKVASSMDSGDLGRSSGDIEDDPEHFLRSSGDDPQSSRDSDDVISFNWAHLFAPEEKDRRNAIKEVTKALQSSLLDNRPSFRQQLPRIVRLAHECPFPDIKKAFQDFLQLVAGDLEKRNITVPEVPRPTKFFKEGVYPVDTHKEPQSSIFRELFLQTGRVGHLDRLLAWHPSFHEVYLKAFNFVMRADGPLPQFIRNYIAILAAARFKCLYLVKQQEEEFLLNGGDPSWLEGLDHLPPKMQKLLEVNAILAHQPWLIKKDHIENLIHGGDPLSRWSTAELVQTFVLMSTFRSLSSFVWGMGVNPELDFRTHSHDGLSSTSSPNPEPIDMSEDVSQNTLQIIDKLKKALEESMEEDTTSTPEQRRQQFEQAGSEPEGSNKFNVADSWGDLAKYIGNYTIQHQDFDVRSKDYEVFHEDDYSWQEQGYELVQRYYSGSADLLDEEFTHIFELTYNKFNDQQGVDTAPFRRSVWYYVHRIFGVIHDDYDYSLVNTYMNRRMKAFIKKVVCQPQLITIADIANLGYHLQPQEKCHLALLAVEARRQAELLYGLHAVMKLMSS